jgi:hypothetical protein
MAENVVVRELLDLDLDSVGRRYPNARRHLEGSVFVSHSGRDWGRVRTEIKPVTDDRWRDSFVHNRASGGSAQYKEIVGLALSCCRAVVVAVSQNAVGHDWVVAEIDVAIVLRRPLIACTFDRTPLELVHPRLASTAPVADFGAVGEGQRVLRTALLDLTPEDEVL